MMSSALSGSKLTDLNYLTAAPSGSAKIPTAWVQLVGMEPYPRIATWAVLKDKYTGKRLLAMNTHLDHMGENARREGSKLLLDKINDITGGKFPVVLTGDFNASPSEVPYLTITDTDNSRHLLDSRKVAKLVYGPAWTYHGFGTIPYEKRPIIDYLFIGGGLKVNKYGVLAETENDAFNSDHAPVLISISL